MKLNYTLAIAFLVAVVGCKAELYEDEIPAPVRQGTMELTLTACSEAELAGKITLEFPSLKWEDSDQIAVFDGSARNIFTIPEGSNNGTSATFRGSVTEGASNLYAVAPASAAENCSDGLMTVSFPDIQRIPGGRQITPEALISVCKAEDGTLHFHNVPALIKVSISSSDITAVLIKGCNLAGTAKVNPDGTLSEVITPEDEVKLIPEGDNFTPGDYYAAVLPGTTTAGSFSISYIRSDGLSCTRTSSKEQTFARNSCKAAGDISAAATWENIIYTKEQLFTWNSTRDPSDAGDAPKLGADIDMEMDPWTPRNFAGTFDGQAHSLYNINVASDTYAGFLRELTGSACVKDLTIGSADGNGYDGQSIIRHSGSANNYTWYYAGAIAKLSNSAALSNIVNFATIEVSAGSTGKTRIGGVVGNWNSSSECKGLINKGVVRNLASKTGQTDSSDATSNSSIMGGVVGFIDLQTRISDCHNSGAVSCTNPGVSAVGGVVGYDGRGSSIESCTNSGPVSHNAAASLVAESAAAGIIAYAKGVSGTLGNVSNCTNEGMVSASCGGKNFRLSGVSGYTQYYNVSDCLNKGQVRFSGSTTASGFLAEGGVVAHTYNGCLVTGCRNEGSVSSNRLQVNRIGGVIGNINNGIVRDCTNSGAITLDNSSSAISNWQGVGGIAGFSEGNGEVRELSGCVNEATGTVSVTVNSIGHDSYHRVAVGGIIGMPYTTMSIADNVNRASVSLQNKHASAPYAYVGGIFGQDSGATSASGVSSNTNYGTISLISGKTGYAAAGGLVGNLSEATSLVGNCNFGDVNGSVAGSVAGVNACSFTATVCDALTVNGTAHGAASDKDIWASPQSSGTITLIVIPHSPAETGGLPKPLDPGNKVVAHRGGATECGYPDNSRAALRYAMSLGCYASECDIYWTSDNDVIVAHADGNDQVNGMNPWEHTAAEIIAAKRLSNYEKIPTLSEYIDIVMSSGSKTKLLLDIKMIDTPSLDYDHPAKAALRAIEIIQEKNAQNFCEFICTGYTGVMSKIASAIKASGIPCGWMNGDISAATFKSRGYTDWANLNTRDHFKLGAADAPDKGTGNRTITEYKNASLQLSVFHIDKQSGNSSAVYTDATVQLYLDEYQYLRCITTNYPAWLLQKTKRL